MFKTLYMGLTRGFAFAASLCVCAANLGLRSALVIFILTRHDARPRTIWLKCFGRPFTFRGRADKGVMSHFYKPGYRIRDRADRSIATIVDCGANIGDETVRFRHFHPKARIVAIEAAAQNFKLLQRNFAHDPLVTCLHKGIWPTAARLKIDRVSSNEGISVAEVAANDATYDVDAISIPDVMRKFGMERIDILKLDVEGTEYELFTRNIDDWIERVNVLIFECPDHERPGTVSALYRKIATMDFDCFVNGENLVLIRRGTGWQCDSALYYR
ncbi:MAG TPA: FkbM family methyltransferase [Candidatus Binataceae bacterium]|nr:FkbM family methyltransferase [Candidatus Binataceae bacterium]